MHEEIIPVEVKMSEISRNTSLSPNNYKKLAILNPNLKEVSYFLDSHTPYQRGVEPGAAAYVDISSQKFLRNSCINTWQYSVDKNKYIYLNPNYYNFSMLNSEDVLLCTDANIGDCCLFTGNPERVIISSGIVKLNFKYSKYKYYVLAFMKDDYFREQLQAKTPRGATIKHSGDLFLHCNIPSCPNEWVYSIIEQIIKNITYAECVCDSHMRRTEKMFQKELFKSVYSYSNPTYKELCTKMRIDSGIYSYNVSQWFNNIKNYIHGYTSLQEFGFGIKRGTNLSKRDLGRAIITDAYHSGYNTLIYPSDISPNGYIEKVSYLGAKKPINFLEERNILFSSEGTIGKTFIVCNNSMRFTTNFHGSIIYPLNNNILLKHSIYLGLYLNFLRSIGIFDKMAVGGNGGSFASGYWNNIFIPTVTTEFIDNIVPLYHNTNQKLSPTQFDIDRLKIAGVYELNNFLIQCKDLLFQLCNDIKNNKLKPKEYYCNLYKNNT